MSKDLPLWENDESDVKLEYRLQFGHTLVSTGDIEITLKKLRSVFKLAKPIMISNKVEHALLPQEQKKGITATVLNDENHWHFVLANIRSHIVIFGPHMLFYDSSKWIKLSRKLRVQLALVGRGDVDIFYYTIFANGKHLCNAARDQSGIHQSKMEPMEFYLDGKLIYKADDEKDQFTEDTLKFLSEDVIIDVDEQQQVRFITPLSKGEIHAPSAIRHVIFGVTGTNSLTSDVTTNGATSAERISC